MCVCVWLYLYCLKVSCKHDTIPLIQHASSKNDVIPKITSSIIITAKRCINNSVIPSTIQSTFRFPQWSQEFLVPIQDSVLPLVFMILYFLLI